MYRYRLVSLLLLSLSLLGSSCSLFQSEPDEGVVKITGNIELTEVRLAFKTSGTIVVLAVEEGDFVNHGDLVARLDAEQLEKQLDQAVASMKSAQARKEELLALLRFQKNHVRAQISQREKEADKARAALQKTRRGARDQEIEQARARLRSARVALEKAEKDWQRAQELIATEDISRSRYDELKAAFEASQASVTEAEQRLDLLREGSRKEDIAMAEAGVASAEAGVELANAGLLEIVKIEKSLKSIEAEIERAEAGVEWMESQLRDTRLYSPISGVVFTKPTEAGEVVLAGATVVTIGDLERPWMRGFIMQTDLGRVKLGNRVRIETDSFPEKDYWGRVSFIASEAEFTPKQIQTAEERVKLVYRIKVDIANENQELKLNMPVDGDILLGDKVVENLR